MDLTMIARTHEPASLELAGHGAGHGLPVPLNEDGGGDCYPNDENEVGP